ncbi:helix-turn-helix domain-containing protein [Weissella koreensis]|uniref:Mga helix-turn-helix domain-containing protein n=2 Tax=Weissella koreensis TaxID=165096 RepID=A0A7H1MNG9_9LACO|nr:helix-turn-helix domain-containing protein [Weissella koreensis]AVH74509.1 hypothetical protein C4597_00115 [Weissella koreensis]AVH75804.1 hypothetical protein C4597_07265 [Weissella koreensis]QGN19732.1 hypothetical protein GKC51_00080 [Weissella koreensis]QGN21023.1 hypothetical protein GKC51_07240 [Weissella koreensis]QNT63771.1 hypothetical protein FY536_00130 [Weissella koreensis]
MLLDFNTTFESSIYNKEVQYKIKILKIISEYSNGIDIFKIKETVKLNERTIHKYILSINQIIERSQTTSDENYKLYGHIIKQHNKYIYTGDHFQFMQLYKKLIDGTVSINLIKKLITHKSIKIEDFANENFISETSLRRSISVFNDHISKYDVSISINKSFISFRGNEINIRFLLVTFMWRNYSGSIWPFDNISKEKMNDIANAINKIYGLTMSIGKQTEFMYLMATNFSRIATGNLINMDDISNNLKDVAILNEEDQELYDYLLSTHNMCDSEITFILLWTKSISDFYFIKNKPLDILNSLKTKKHIIYNKIYKYITSLEDITKTKIDLTTIDGKTFIATLLAGKYHSALFKKLNFTIANIDSTKLNIEKVPNLMKVITHLTEQINSDLSKEELGTLIYFNISAFLILFPEYYFEPTINILIQMDAPIFEEAAFAKKTKDRLTPYLNVSVSYINHKDQKYDLVISTIVDEEEEHDTDHYVMVSNNMTDKDFNNVLLALNIISK